MLLKKAIMASLKKSLNLNGPSGGLGG